MKSIKLVASAATIVLMATTSAAVSAATVQCGELKKLVAAAESHFDGLGAAGGERETAADLAARFGVPIEELGIGRDYEKLTLATEQPLSGANQCEIVDVTMVDEDMDLRQTAFNCRYASLYSIPGSLREELENCLQQPIDPESDKQSLTILVDLVESGEGYTSTALEVNSNAVDGMTLGIVRTVCLNRSKIGCESGE